MSAGEGAWLDSMLAQSRAFVRHPSSWVQVEAHAAELLIPKRPSAPRVREICHAAPLDAERQEKQSRDAYARDEARRLDKIARYDRSREKAEARAREKAEVEGVGPDGTPV